MIPEPGLYRNVDFNEYQTWDALNPSLVVAARTTLKDFDHARRNPKTPTTAMIMGSASHCTVLEPDEFPLRYVVWQGKRVGNAFAEFKRVNLDKVILNEDEYASCIGMRKAVHSHPIAGPMLKADAERELCVVWNNPATGLLCKGRLDFMSDVIADLKTIRTPDERTITQEVVRFGYHIRLAAYQEGIREVTGETTPLKLVFVGSDAPHDVVVVPVADEALDCGRRRWTSLLEKIKGGMESGRWPGLAEDQELPLILPTWELEAGADLKLTMGGMDFNL